MRLVGCFVALLTAWLAAPAGAQAPPGGYSELYSFGLDFRTPARTQQFYFDVMQPGEAMDISAAVRVPNEGSPAPAGPFTVAFVLSDDIYYSPDDLELWQWRVDGLASGQASGTLFPPNVVVPDVPFGFYYVLMVIDADEEVEETDEGNNVDRIQLNVGGRYYYSPNLIGGYDSDYGVDDGFYEPGESFTLRYGVLNVTSTNWGDASGDFTVGYTIQRLSVEGEPAVLIGSEPMGSIDPFEQEDESEQLTVPADALSGVHEVCAVLDLDNDVVEWHEWNLSCYWIYVADPLRLPHLVASVPTLPRRLSPGLEFRVRATVSNRGDGAVPASTLGLALSLDGRYSPDDRVFARLATPALPPSDGTFGSSVTVTETVTVPSDLPAGSYVVVPVPDVDNVAALPSERRRYYGVHHAFVPGVVSDASEPDAALALDAPRPNPTSGAAQVSFSLAAPGEVRLAVVDVLGREVAVLDESVLGAGMHEAAVPPGLAPGLYVVRLNAANQTRTQTLTIVR